MSPGSGTPEKLEEKFGAVVKKEAVASPSDSEPVTVSVGSFEITVSPKRPSKSSSSTSTADTRSSTTSPGLSDASTMTESAGGGGGHANAISDVKQRMKDNLAFIREKVNLLYCLVLYLSSSQ